MHSQIILQLLYVLHDPMDIYSKYSIYIQKFGSFQNYQDPKSNFALNMQTMVKAQLLHTETTPNENHKRISNTNKMSTFR